MQSKFTLQTVRTQLASLSPAITIRKRDGEYCVRIKGSPKGHGYFTDDLQDALNTGKDLSRRNALHGNTILI